MGDVGAVVLMKSESRRFDVHRFISTVCFPCTGEDFGCFGVGFRFSNDIHEIHDICAL